MPVTWYDVFWWSHVTFWVGLIVGLVFGLRGEYRVKNINPKELIGLLERHGQEKDTV